jgi:adenosylcobinamide-GDP ribazoletransferase
MRRAIAFLTPLGGAAPPDGRTAAWFGPAGFLIGLAVGGIWWGADHLWTAPIAAAVAIAADLALTGMLHVDGLADSADGLLPHLDRARRLEVMAAPDVGAYGVAVVVATLLIRFAVLVSMAPDPLLLACLWCASRALMAATLTSVAYAREGGLATAFAGGSVIAPVVAIGAASTAALFIDAGPLRGVGAVMAVLVAGTGIVGLAHRRIGGYTGDVLGAAGVIGETVGLLVVTGSWR